MAPAPAFWYQVDSCGAATVEDVPSSVTGAFPVVTEAAHIPGGDCEDRQTMVARQSDGYVRPLSGRGDRHDPHPHHKNISGNCAKIFVVAGRPIKDEPTE